MTPPEPSRGEDQIAILADDLPLRPAPVGLRRRVAFRVGLIAMAKREHRRVRLLSGAGLLFSCLACVSVVILLVNTELGPWIARSLPGAMGYWDYFSGQSFSALGAAAFLATAALVAGWAVVLVNRNARTF